jgi:hypothetical protein
MKSKLLEKSSKAVSKILLAAQNFTRQLYFNAYFSPTALARITLKSANPLAFLPISRGFT